MRIINGRARLVKAMDDFLKSIYEYNSIVRKKGYYLKPYHVVVRKTKGGVRRYYYYGRYWYRVRYVGKKGRTSIVKWEYVGKSKPEESLPDPPSNPLEGIVFLVEGEDVILREEDYHKIKDLFKGLKVQKISVHG